MLLRDISVYTQTVFNLKEEDKIMALQLEYDYCSKNALSAEKITNDVIYLPEQLTKR